MVKEQSDIASKLYQLQGVLDAMRNFSFAQGSQGYSTAVLEKNEIVL